MTLAIDRPTNGHKVDVEALYREKRDRFVGFAARAGRDPHAAEDAVQEAFTKALERPDVVAGARDLGNVIAVNAKYGALAASADRGRQTPTDAAIMQRQADVASPADVAGDALCMGDPAVAAKVEEALAQLPDREREAVRRRFLEGQKVSDIAAAMGVVSRTVYGLANSGLAKLRAAGVALPDVDGEPAEPDELDKVSAAVATLTDNERTAIQAVCLDGRTALDIATECGISDSAIYNRVKKGLLKLGAAGVGVDDLGPTLPPAPNPLPQIPGVPPALVAALMTLRADYGQTPPADVPGPAELCRLYGWDKKKASRARALYVGHRIRPPQAGGRVSRLAKTGVVAAPRRAQVQHAAVVAEAWLSTSGTDVTCMFVNSDESTTKHPAVFRSMSGAQREITGHLVAEGYRPTSPWTEEGPDESFRTFTNQP
jgi:RNA polymerase sigma factor (sigma-70 family)